MCNIADLQEGRGRGFGVRTDDGYQDIFLVCKNGRISGYHNSCPHTGSPLDWVPDQFLNLEGNLIQCATHDALFRIEDGVCVAGPCTGKSLTPIKLEVLGEEVYVVGDYQVTADTQAASN